MQESPDKTEVAGSTPRFRRFVVEMDFYLDLMVTGNAFLCVAGFDEGTEALEVRVSKGPVPQIGLLLWNRAWPEVPLEQEIPLQEISYMDIPAPPVIAGPDLITARS